jgi:KAP family P-loop domain
MQKDKSSDKINLHVTEFLDQYIDIKRPQYAVLMNGPWGSGKTWFIKNYAKKIIADRRRKSIYVSLYGVSSTAQIDDIFFEQLHPVLSSKPFSIGTKVVKGTLKTALKIDLDSVKMNEIFTDANDRILIFDDLERCNLDLQVTLGYINYCVEHFGNHCVILTNEEELAPVGDVQKSTVWKRTKEKLVGQTLQVKPDVKALIQSVIAEYLSSTLSRICSAKEEAVIDVFDAGGFGNLRHLRQALLSFEHLSHGLPKFSLQNDDFLLEVLLRCIAYNMEVRAGKMDIVVLGNLTFTYLSASINMQQQNELKPIVQIVKKYNTFFDFPDPLLEGEVWIAFLGRGELLSSKIEESVKRTSYFIDGSQPEWMRLWHYDRLSDAEFEKLSQATHKQLEEAAFENAYECIHVVGLLLDLCEKRLIKGRKNKIIQLSKTNIRKLRNDRKLIYGDTKCEPRSVDRDSAYGLGFSARSTAEMKDFFAFVDQETQLAWQDSLPQIGQDLLALMAHDVSKFARDLILNNHEDNLYFQTPILVHVSPEVFVAELKKQGRDAQRVVNELFERRYSSGQNEKLQPEIDWLKKVKSCLTSEAKKAGKLERYFLLKFRDECMEKAIKAISALNPTNEPLKN